MTLRRRGARREAESGAEVALLCPACGAHDEGQERFCAHCGMPLVQEPGRTDGEHGPGDPRTQARKVKPQYADGELMKVTSARDQTEAEFIQGLLLEEGVPSMTRRSRGFDVPDFLTIGPRDILVPESGLAVAREVLLQSELLSGPRSDAGVSSVDTRTRVIAALLLALIVLFVIASVMTRL